MPVKKTKARLKFAVPSKIVMVNRKSIYCENVFNAVCVGLIQLMIGALNMVVLMYTMVTKDLHAVLCCLAFHFFSVEAIFCMSHVNGWSSPLRLRHRWYTHVLLQICAVICAVVGTILIVSDKGMSTSFHGLLGLVALILMIVAVVLGLTVLCLNAKFASITHLTFGILTFSLASASLCLGFLLPAFKTWAGSTITFILIGFVAFYTVFIIITTFLKCVARL